MEQKVSNKITYLYFLMSILILNLHSVYMEQFQASELALVVNQFVKIICNMSVPTFFFISALLFYRNCEKKQYSRVILAKIKTLIIPYICWNLICFPLKEFKNYLATGSIATVGIKDIVYKVLMSQYDPVLWFIRVLFIYFLFYPVILFLVRRQRLCLGLIALLLGINIIIGPVTGYSTARYWLPIYLLGGYLGYWRKDNIFHRKTRLKLIYVSFSLVTLIILVIGAYFSDIGMYLCRMISPLCYWVMGDIFFIERSPKWIEKQSFYIYCTQMIFSVVAQKVWIGLFGNGLASALFANAGIPLILLVVILITARVFHLIMPKLYDILTGGRSE